MILASLALSRAAVDRDGAHRADPTLIDRLWLDETTRVLVVESSTGRTPVVAAPDDATALPASPGGGTLRLALVGPSDAPPGLRLYLGRDRDGLNHVAVSASALAPDVAVEWSDLRQAGWELSDRDAGLLSEAVALSNWHATHPRCPRCGAATTVVQAGWSRRCPADGSEHFPRTDPAVIMAVVDDEDRILLGRHARWPTGRFSTLAGFVEPGESLEAAVRREVVEESGVVVGSAPDDVRYLGSQPWPFPSSIMLGFRARAVGTAVVPDGEEIESARWFTHSELDAAVAAGELLLPPPVSIARRLIEDWAGAVLPARQPDPR